MLTKQSAKAAHILPFDTLCSMVCVLAMCPCLCMTKQNGPASSAVGVFIYANLTSLNIYRILIIYIYVSAGCDRLRCTAAPLPASSSSPPQPGRTPPAPLGIMSQPRGSQVQAGWMSKGDPACCAVATCCTPPALPPTGQLLCYSTACQQHCMYIPKVMQSWRKWVLDCSQS